MPWPSSDRKSTRLNSSHLVISYAVFCLKKKTRRRIDQTAGESINMSVVESSHPIEALQLLARRHCWVLRPYEGSDWLRASMLAHLHTHAALLICVRY